MKHVKLLVFPGVLIVLLAVLLIRTPGIHAAPARVTTPSSCGSWKIVKSPNVGTDSIFKAVVAISANDVWATGYATGYKPLMEHWNGTQWQVVPSPAQKNGAIMNGLAAISTNDIWAVGRGNQGENGNAVTMHWDGTRWKLFPAPSLDAGTALQSVTAISTKNVWAVGAVYGTSNGSEYATLIEHWNGTRWSIVSSPSSIYSADILEGVSAVSAKDIWAVGNVFAGGTIGTLAEIEHWDGTKWSLVNPANNGQNSPLYGVTAISANNVWAVGYNSSTNVGQTLVEHWNGTSWSIVASPNVGMGSNALTAVTAVSANNIWATGNYYISTFVTQTLIEHWDGTQWSVVKSPNAGTSNNYLNGVSSVPGTSDVWTVGSYGKDYSSQKSLTEYYC